MSDFVKNNAPSGKKSKLDNFVKEILGLKNLGYSEKDILRFLHKKRGITVSQPTLNRFVRSRAGKTSTLDETGIESSIIPYRLRVGRPFLSLFCLKNNLKNNSNLKKWNTQSSVNSI